MRNLEIVHRTRYEFSEPVTFGEYRLMFRPRDSHDLRLLDTRLIIEPAGSIRWVHDPFGNSIAIATFNAPGTALEFVSTIRLEHFGVRTELPPIEEYARKLPFSYSAAEAPDLVRLIERHYPDPNAVVTNWARRFLAHDEAEEASVQASDTAIDQTTGQGGAQATGQADTFATLSRMCSSIQKELNYGVRLESGTQTPGQTLELGSGTCRDFALLMMEGARTLGLAARFVTGYLYDPELDKDDADKAWPHAWMEVYLPGAGWMEFDPTNGIIGTDRLIRVAVGRDPEQAMPINGSFTGPPGAWINTAVEVTVRTVPPAMDAAAAAPAIAPAPAPAPTPAPVQAAP